eukprot:290293-Chlamydomonas_euryale.AAC.1
MDAEADDEGTSNVVRAGKARAGRDRTQGGETGRGAAARIAAVCSKMGQEWGSEFVWHAHLPRRWQHHAQLVCCCMAMLG